MITCTCGKTVTGITTIHQGDYVDILWTTRANEKGCCSVMDLPNLVVDERDITVDQGWAGPRRRAFTELSQAIDIACEIAELNEITFVGD